MVEEFRPIPSKSWAEMVRKVYSSLLAGGEVWLISGAFCFSESF